MGILKIITYISIVTVSTTWTIAGIKVIKKISLIDEFKDEIQNNVKGATDKLSNAADNVTSVTNRIFKG